MNEKETATEERERMSASEGGCGGGGGWWLGVSDRLRESLRESLREPPWLDGGVSEPKEPCAARRSFFSGLERWMRLSTRSRTRSL